MVFVALVAVPLNEAVIVPAVKLPDAFLSTRVDAVFAEVAFVPRVTFPATPVALLTVSPDPAVTSTCLVTAVPDPVRTIIPVVVKSLSATKSVSTIDAVNVTSDPPLTETLPLKSPPKERVLAVCHVDAVVAFPESAAVIVPALKLPEESRTTTVLTTLFDAVSRPFRKFAFKLFTLVVEATTNGAVPVVTVEVN